MVSFLLRIFSSTKQAIVVKIILVLIYKEKIHRRGFIPFSNFYWVGKKITFDTIKAKSQKMVPSSLHKSLVCCMIHHDSKRWWPLISQSGTFEYKGFGPMAIFEKAQNSFPSLP